MSANGHQNIDDFVETSTEQGRGKAPQKRQAKAGAQLVRQLELEEIEQLRQSHKELERELEIASSQEAPQRHFGRKRGSKKRQAGLAHAAKGKEPAEVIKGEKSGDVGGYREEKEVSREQFARQIQGASEADSAADILKVPLGMLSTSAVEDEGENFLEFLLRMRQFNIDLHPGEEKAAFESYRLRKRDTPPDGPSHLAAQPSGRRRLSWLDSDLDLEDWLKQQDAGRNGHG